MPVPWGLVTFIIGLFYGWLSPGREAKWALLKTGLLIGLVLALVFVLLGFLVGATPLGLGGGLSIFVSVVVLTLLFILGAWLGDLIERSTTKGAQP